MPLALVELFGAALYRILPHPHNLTPVAAMAFVGGLYLGRRHALWIPILALAISDALLGMIHGYPLVHHSTWAVYGAFLAIGCIGLALRHTRSPLPILAGILGGSLLFFFLTNTAAWLGLPQLYARSLSGWTAAIAAGLPFYRAQLLGDLGFTTLFIAAIELARRTTADTAWAWIARPAAER